MEQARYDTAAVDSVKRYASPEIKVVLMSSLNVLCQSGNEPMREADYGDGGFGEE